MLTRKSVRSRIARLHLDAALVGADDLLHDIQAEAEPFASARLPLPAAERVEDVGQHLRRNAAGIGYTEFDAVRRRAVQPDPHRRTVLSILQCVADEIGRHLRQAVGIPCAGQVARPPDFDAPLRERDLVLVHHPVDERAQVRRAGGDGNAPREPRPRQVEHRVDHPAHALSARQHARGGLAHGFVFALQGEQLRRHQHGAERIAQIVAEDRGEHFVEAQGLGAFVQFLGELLLLAMELEENVRLVPQHVRVYRLVQEIHRAGFVTLEQPVLVVRAGGDENDRHVARAFAAAHEFGQFETIHLRHVHVEQGEGHVMQQQQLERFGAGAGLDQFDVVALQQRREDQEVFLEVVDDQAFHALRHGFRFRLRGWAAFAVPSSSDFNRLAIDFNRLAICSSGSTKAICRRPRDRKPRSNSREGGSRAGLAVVIGEAGSDTPGSTESSVMVEILPFR